MCEFDPFGWTDSTGISVEGDFEADVGEMVDFGNGGFDVGEHAAGLEGGVVVAARSGFEDDVTLTISLEGVMGDHAEGAPRVDQQDLGQGFGD